ncbi:MAG: malonic semialdehyde reductase [Rhizobiales bacterium]|nr:malonic semialdehyde reductase [Hyphomicrobiales bacterium]MBN9009274.1 malonic semialdehyde reductase [Hyphomicrobiales bacterium]
MNQTVDPQTLAKAEPTAVLGSEALERLFRGARSHNAWQPKPVPHALLREAVELAKMAPTAANSSPLRVVFVESAEGKERLKAALDEGNVEKTMTAPVTAILAHDEAFHVHMGKLFPHAPHVGGYFAGNQAAASHVAFHSGTLQVAYFILALRALGLDAGPLAGFDREKVDAAFFAGTKVKSNLVVNIGYGDHAKLFPRNPRLDFDEIATFA